MRSIWFALAETSVADVERELQHHQFTHSEPPGHPSLYINCGGYEWVAKYDLQDEYDELLQATGGLIPTVHVSADVSGRIPGDDEVRRLARILLSKFKGFAFDDFLAYGHAWTLSEIESNTHVDGLRFFDYLGHFQRSQALESPRRD